MTWYPKDASYGNIIRVRLGSIYHYGIFVSEDNVIQFGLPPIPQYKMPSEEITVCSTDIEVFSCGQIVEVAVFSDSENKTRFSDEEIVRRAEARKGRGGYSLLHNNCEHFVHECAFGKSVCTVEEEAIERWRNRPVFDLYIMPLDSNSAADNPSKAVSELMKTALSHTTRKGADELKIQKRLGGARCGSTFLSFARSEQYAVVLISDQPCGVSFEIVSDVTSLEKVRSRTEKKAKRKKDGFLPFFRKKAESDSVGTVRAAAYGMILSFCGKSRAKIRYYTVSGNNVSLCKVGETEEL